MSLLFGLYIVLIISSTSWKCVGGSNPDSSCPDQFTDGIDLIATMQQCIGNLEECQKGIPVTHINECQPDPCVNGNCTDLFNGYNCSCDPGYNGTNCSIDINECKPDPCVNGSCTDLFNGYNCSCDPGYNGTNCSIDINECKPDPCVNGSCTDLINGYNCSCYPGFTGTNCSIDINKCKPDLCMKGNCTNQISGYNCKCDAGYYGRNCSTDWFPPGNGFQYKTINKVSQATDAIKECEDEGARLASAGIRNQTIQRIIFQELKLLDSDQVWIGLKKTNDTWWWSDHVQLNTSDPRLYRLNVAADNAIYSYIQNDKIEPASDSPFLEAIPLCEKQLA